MSSIHQKLYKLPKKKFSGEEVRCVRCNQMCAEFECSCWGPHEYNEEECSKKCEIAPRAECVPVKGEAKPVVLKFDKKKVIKEED